MKVYPDLPDHSDTESGEEMDEGQAQADSLVQTVDAGENEDRETQTAHDVFEKEKKLRPPIGINLNNCRYDSVRRAVQAAGFQEVKDDEEWTVYWTNTYVSQKRAMDLNRFQMVNRFPGMNEICRKDLLAKNMNRLFKLFPKEYNIFPRTWSLPDDYEDFLAYSRTRKRATYICKPGRGCQGKGIFLSCNANDIKPGAKMVCQQYLAKPFLIDGLKFDLRIYVLVTSCDPLRIFIHDEGIVRFATVSYTEPNQTNLDAVCMHLTNYAINKESPNFIRDDVRGSKRKLSTLKSWLEARGYDTVKLWSDIDDVIIKTLISIQPILKHKYQTSFPYYGAGGNCFHIIGFDIILDQALKPWLLEVNDSPSFVKDSCLDQEVKDAVLKDALDLVSIRAHGKRAAIEEERRVTEHLLRQNLPKELRQEQLENIQTAWQRKVEEYEDSHLGGYRMIYPSGKAEQYSKFFQPRGLQFKETTTSKARAECVRKQRQELDLQQHPPIARFGIKTRVKKDVIQGEPACENPATLPRIPLPGPTSNLTRIKETKPRFARPQAVCQETESVSVLPLPNSRSRDTAPSASTQLSARRHSNRDLPHLPSLLQSGRGAPPSPSYTAGRQAHHRVVQNIRATAAASEPVNRPTRDSQRSFSCANNKTGQKNISGVPSGSLKSSAHGERPPDRPRSFLPAVSGNRSIVAASSSASVTRRAQQSRQQMAGVANVNRNRR